MELIVKAASTLGLIALLSGCVKTPDLKDGYTYDVKKIHIIKYQDESYHYRPDHTWSYKLNANSANMNNVTSGGILSCKEGDIWFISLKDREEERKIRYRYFISLSKFQLNDMREDPHFIPRENSKEFKNLIRMDTEYAKQGLIGCSGKIPKAEMEKIIPQSRAISVPAL